MSYFIQFRISLYFNLKLIFSCSDIQKRKNFSRQFLKDVGRYSEDLDNLEAEVEEDQPKGKRKIGNDSSAAATTFKKFAGTKDIVAPFKLKGGETGRVCLKIELDKKRDSVQQNQAFNEDEEHHSSNSSA